MPDATHILLVEDNLGDVALIEASFADAGLPVRFTVAHNAPQAFRLLRTPNLQRPDLIIVDLNLPIIGGHEILREFKAHRPWNGVPTIVFSSSSLPRDIESARELGVTVYIVKPKGYEGYLELVDQARRHLVPQPRAMSRVSARRTLSPLDILDLLARPGDAAGLASG